MAREVCCVIYHGKVLARPYTKWCALTPPSNVYPNTGFDFLGNVSSFKITVDKEKKEVKSYTGTLGAVDCSIEIPKYGIELTVNCHKDLALKLGYGANGTEDNIVAGTATEIKTISKLDEYFPLEFIPDSATVVVNTGAIGGPYSTPLINGVDYEVTSTGIHILGSSTAITAFPTEIEIVYNYNIQSHFDFFKNLSGEYEIIIDGNNVGGTGNPPFKAHVHRVKLGVASEMQLIGDDFAQFTISGSLLEDDCVPAPHSKLFHLSR